MRLFVPYNGEDDLIPSLSGISEVSELYGKMTADFVGGGKHSFQTPLVGRRRLERAVRQAHGQGLKFNYLLNSSCLDNREWTGRGQREIRALLDWAAKLGVDSITVAVPYLLELIKKRYPGMKVYVSTISGVNTVRKARQWEELGADRITVLNTETNRDFATLKKMRDEVGCEICLIVNANCLYDCPFYGYHANLAAHSSQSGHASRGFVLDYCRIRCRYRQIMDPVDFIRSSWIRPEDLRIYEEMGIDCFKVIDRGMSTRAIISAVQAYSLRLFEGNLLDLFPQPSRGRFFGKPNPLPMIRFFFRPFSVNVFRLRNFSGLIDGAAYVDNRSLDGFLEGLMKRDCARTSCPECGYCHAAARRAVRIDEKAKEVLAGQYRDRLEEMVSGKLFRYF